MAMDPTIIDPAALNRLEEGGGTGLLHQMVRLFRKNAPSRLEQIRTCRDGDDMDQPERGAHSLKSSAANVGAERVREIAGDIERAASDKDAKRVRELLPGLEEAFTVAIQELESLLKEGAE